MHKKAFDQMLNHQFWSLPLLLRPRAAYVAGFQESATQRTQASTKAFIKPVSAVLFK